MNVTYLSITLISESPWLLSYMKLVAELPACSLVLLTVTFWETIWAGESSSGEPGVNSPGATADVLASL